MFIGLSLKSLMFILIGPKTTTGESHLKGSFLVGNSGGM